MASAIAARCTWQDSKAFVAGGNSGRRKTGGIEGQIGTIVPRRRLNRKRARPHRWRVSWKSEFRLRFTNPYDAGQHDLSLWCRRPACFFGAGGTPAPQSRLPPGLFSFLLLRLQCLGLLLRTRGQRAAGIVLHQRMERGHRAIFPPQAQLALGGDPQQLIHVRRIGVDCL